MTAAVGAAPKLRISAGVWFATGLLAAAVLVAVAQAGSVEVSPASTLLRSRCASPVVISVSRPGQRATRLTLREPGVYRLSADPGADFVVVAGGARRLLSELPLGEAGELLLPAEWCAASSWTGAGLGPGY